MGGAGVGALAGVRLDRLPSFSMRGSRSLPVVIQSNSFWASRMMEAISVGLNGRPAAISAHFARMSRSAKPSSASNCPDSLAGPVYRRPVRDLDLRFPFDLVPDVPLRVDYARLRHSRTAVVSCGSRPPSRTRFSGHGSAVSGSVSTESAFYVFFAFKIAVPTIMGVIFGTT